LGAGCIPAVKQYNLKRLLGYSSVAHAGYMLLGVAAMASAIGGPKGQDSTAGASAILYYLSGYLFTVLGAFLVICLVMRTLDGENIDSLAGLNQRSPLLAATLALAMVSLGGIPPLAGFFGKFLLLRAAIEQGSTHPGFYTLAFIAVAGVVISLYYYFGVIRAIYWSKDTADLSPIPTSKPSRIAIYACVLGMLYLGLFPGAMVDLASQAVKVCSRTAQ
jgi:NADH-quinone oxidoreductase subunit N